MNVEVEVVRETRATYLVQARSLEGAEKLALECAAKNVSASGCVKMGRSRTGEHWVAWSEPVQVRDGKVVKDVREG